jgi:hypothetical protein
MKGLIMAHKSRIDRTLFCSLKKRHVLIVAVVASAALNAGQSAAQAPTMELTQVGSPIWRPVDFELFSAPAATEEQQSATLAAIRGDTYTDHPPPYDHELSANVAAAGFVSRSVFPREALDHNPNSIVYPILVLPDPGIIGESRDFASGPIIPNSLFPFTSSEELWQDGEFSFSLFSGVMNVRPEDAPFEGTSHRMRIRGLWKTGPDVFGSYEIRYTLIDAEGNGWNMVFPFKVVRAGDFDEDGDVDAADYVVWRKTDGTQTGYDAWRANFGTSLLAGSGSAGYPLGASAESLPAVPEPATLMIACVAAISISVAGRRTLRREGRQPCAG